MLNQLTKNTIVSFFVLTSTFANSADSSKVEQSLLQKISRAESELSKVGSQVAKQRGNFSKQLASLEQELVTLEKKAVSARKIADEQNLNLTQLQERLESWQNQNSYQQNLLQQFLRLHSPAEANARANSAVVPIEQKLNQVADITEQVESWFEPSFSTTELVLESGQIAKAELISFGPTHWMLANNQAYRGEVVNGEWVVQHQLSQPINEALINLQQGQPATLSFDPSFSKLTQVPQEGLIDHVYKGGVWIMPILAFALVALLIAIARGVTLWSLPKVHLYSPSSLIELIQGNTEPNALGKMQMALLNIAKQSRTDLERDDQLFQQLQQDKVTLEKRLTAIAITASVAPLLGLLGTVSGMIETFRMMTIFGSGDPEVVSGGIAQALITTEMGLVVAIPALVIHAILSRRAKAYYSQLENFALMLSQADIHSTQTPSHK